MIQFYEAESGLDLSFPITGTDGQPLTSAPSAGYPKLYVEGSSASPILLASTSVPGTYHHVTLPGEFVVPAGEVIHYFECYIDWRGSDRVIISDAFRIAVVKAPSTSLQ